MAKRKKRKPKPIMLDLVKLRRLLKSYATVGSKETTYYLTLPDMPKGKVLFGGFILGFKPLIINESDQDFLIEMLTERKVNFQDLRTVEKFKDTVGRFSLDAIKKNKT